MTWGEIKIITLQKMFAKDEPIGTKNLSSLVNDDDCKVYISNMPAVANEAIQRLSRYCQLNIIEVSDSKIKENASTKEEMIVLEEEGERILKKIKENELLILIDFL